MIIKTLLKSVREFKLATILAPIFMIGEIAFEVSIPTVMARLIDFGIDKGDMDCIVETGILLIVCTVCAVICGSLSGRFSSVASAGFARNLRQDMYHNIQNFSFSNIDKFSTASIITRLTTDVSILQQSYMMIIRMAIRSPGMLVISFSVAFSIAPKLAMIFLFCLPVLGGGLALIITHAHPYFRRVFKTFDKLNSKVQENLRGIRVVKTFIREDYEKEKFGKISQSIFNDFTKAEKTVAFNAPLMQICIYTCMILVSWFGARMVVASGNNEELGLSTGELLSLFTYTTQILMSLMMLSFVFVQITLSRAGAERVVEIINEKSDITSKENCLKEVKDGSISFKNVNFAYSSKADKNCLSNVNLEIRSGETVGIIGGTGSSKSTLVQLIPRLYDVSSGSVEVGGADVRDYDVETLRNEVAMVLQKNVLFSGTIKENLRWGDENASDEDIVRVCKLAQADSFIENFPDKYDTYIEQGGTNVSGGQKQRLCIARALLKKPKILILDDSTSAVDTATDAKIRKAFRDEIPDTTKIIIAQRVSSVEDADKIIVMDDGKILAVGAHKELIENCDVYREVYESQKKGAEDDE